jgi:hypothetical protein
VNGWRREAQLAADRLTQVAAFVKGGIGGSDEKKAQEDQNQRGRLEPICR